ncbi:M23 family metallopeptidase [Corticibacter populi]|uniref:M23 family metallopeptidase n=1 Tax=Corticibacter populi TaxID=1550736 RepID=A0A3M6QSR8_9BURK|nr:M23 family metallopeptidase [Corticibacter populi]RMX06043.1 M23 family metallopeptidase [Corticibacter populi]RZS30905.1 peptidase M23-like protein [Corticibacter populi]
MTLPTVSLPALLRRLAGWLAALLGIALLAAWAWQQPFMAAPRMFWTLGRLPPPSHLPVPVQGVAAGRIADTYGAPRSGGRKHEGVDIFAPRGTPVVSATPGIVVSVRESGLGGRQVWVLGPARQRHYYAHLQDWAEGITAGTVVHTGQPLGTVGDSGNARGTPPHLHYGIYGSGGAYDPLPLLQANPLNP